MRKIAFISGASSGIGKAAAIRLSQDAYDLILTARRSELLEELKIEMQKSRPETRIFILKLDVRNAQEVEQQLDTLTSDWRNIDVLINNAGLAAGLDHIQEGKLDDWERMIDTNIKGLLYVSKKITPWMVERKSGHIINIGSIAGKNVYEKGNVYCATKYAVDAISQGMRIDLLKHGIKVSNISPGAVNTEFSTVRFDGDKEKADCVYDGFTPLYANDIAEAIAFIVSRPSHVNINEMLIMPTNQANAYYIDRE